MDRAAQAQRPCAPVSQSCRGSKEPGRPPLHHCPALSAEGSSVSPPSPEKEDTAEGSSACRALYVAKLKQDVEAGDPRSRITGESPAPRNHCP